MSILGVSKFYSRMTWFPLSVILKEFNQIFYYKIKVRIIGHRLW